MLKPTISLFSVALALAVTPPALHAQASTPLSAISRPPLGSDSTWSKFAGNYGVGLEYRFRRVGVRAEGRDFVYKFDRYGFDKTQHDIAWQGGLTLSF